MNTEMLHTGLDYKDLSKEFLEECFGEDYKQIEIEEEIEQTFDIDDLFGERNLEDLIRLFKAKLMEIIPEGVDPKDVRTKLDVDFSGTRISLFYKDSRLEKISETYTRLKGEAWRYLRGKVEEEKERKEYERLKAKFGE